MNDSVLPDTVDGPAPVPPASFDLRGKTCLITGGGKGIGRWIALGLARAGADVAVGARTLADVESVAQEIRAVGRRALAVPLDVGSLASIDRAVATVTATLGSIDTLVNNAGVNFRKAAVDYTEADFDAVVGTNLRGTFFCSQVVGRTMLERRTGSVINISSTVAQVFRRGVPNSAYAAAKAGVVTLTRALAEEWSTFGVRVNCLALGRCDTEMNQRLAPAGSREQATVLESVPLGRLGQAADVVGPAVFLASDAASFITGQTVFVDGGRTIL